MKSDQPKNICEPGHEKTCLMSYASNKGADQPALPRSLISAFVVRCLDSIISLNFCSRNLKTPASLCGRAGRPVSGPAGNPPKTRFVMSRFMCICVFQASQPHPGTYPDPKHSTVNCGENIGNLTENLRKCCDKCLFYI